ncbi:hypothetical protein GGS24DRAFT_504102 [Hypoxylon argillaceum]|nr:hypothetical protein GGS24DRAFT_504102 [Hypoxylon argillaceum]
MNEDIFETRTRCSRANSLYMDTELPQNPEDQSPVGRDLFGDLPLRSAKRSLDAAFDIDPGPAKRARLTRTGGQQPGVWNEKLEQVAETTIQQPKPTPVTKPNPLFLEDFVDSVFPHFPPKSVYASVSQWLESVESDEEKHYRSGSCLDYGNDDLISRENTISAPEVAYTRDSDGFVMSPTPLSIRSRSEVSADAELDGISDISGRSSTRRLIETPLYRKLNLAMNGIYLRKMNEEFPTDVASLVDHIGRKRDSPSPPPDQVLNDAELHRLEDGATGADVGQYFSTHIYPYPKPTESLKRSDRQPMLRYAVPGSRSKPRVSNPVPDMLYGYTTEAFSQRQQQIVCRGPEMLANHACLLFPFFVIELRGDGPAGTGSLWGATNQCLAGSASCVNIIERLNYRLKDCKSDKSRPINNVAFSVAMNGTEARLYISWKNELDFNTQKIDSFLLQNPRDYLEFRKYVRNIIEWGKEKRLNEIRDSLDILLEVGRNELM